MKVRGEGEDAILHADNDYMEHYVKPTAAMGTTTTSTPVRHPASERFHQLLKEMGELHDKKQLDYGTDTDPFANVGGSAEWGIQPWIGAMVRATDKIRRLMKFAIHGKLANESVRDSFLDLAVYALIGLVLYERGQNG